MSSSITPTLKRTANLADLLDASAARTHLGVGTGDTPTLAGVVYSDALAPQYSASGRRAMVYDPGDGAGKFGLCFQPPSPNTSGADNQVVQWGWNLGENSLYDDPSLPYVRMAIERRYVAGDDGTVPQSEFHWALGPPGAPGEIRVLTASIRHDGSASVLSSQADRIAFLDRTATNQYATFISRGTDAADGGCLQFNGTGNYVLAGDGRALLGQDAGTNVVLGDNASQVLAGGMIFNDFTGSTTNTGKLFHDQGAVTLVNQYDGFTADQDLFVWTGTNYGGAGNGTFSLALTASGQLENTSPFGWRFSSGGNQLFGAGIYGGESIYYVGIPFGCQVIFNNTPNPVATGHTYMTVGLGYEADGMLKVSNGRASGYGQLHSAGMQLNPVSGLTDLTPADPMLATDAADNSLKFWNLVSWKTVTTG